MFTKDILYENKNGFNAQKFLYHEITEMSEMHYHNHYEILHISQNSRILSISGNEYELNKDNIALISPFIPHMTTSGLNIPQTRILIAFREDYIHEIRKSTDIDLLSCFGNPCNIISIKNFQKQFYEITENFLKHPTYISSYYKNTYNKLNLCELLTILSSVSPKKDSCENFSDIIRFVENNFNEKITLEYLAKKFYMSKYTISRNFSKYTGTSLPKYLNTIRIINAKKHLEHGLKVTETAFLCGFDNTTSFDRVFLSQTGITPSKYKNSYFKNSNSSSSIL